MPELLEVEFYRRAAEAALQRTIDSVDAPDAWYIKGGVSARAVGDALVGRHLVAARRRGKLLLLDVAGPDAAVSGSAEDKGRGPTLGLRFGMTGRLIVDGAAPIERLEYSSDRDDPAWDRFRLNFADAGTLVMRDPRRLGGVELDPNEERLGPDAWTVTVDELGLIMGSSTSVLKVRLMDQARIAGLGNLLADEIMWRSGLDPARPARSVDSDELGRLAATVWEVLDELDRRGGSHRGDLHDERSPDGVCPRDGTPLQRRTIGGRTTYSCPAHQR